MSEPPAASPHDRPPFAAWPTQFAIANGTGRLWYVGGGTICVQITATRGDLAMAKDYVAAIRAIRAMHRDDFLAANGIGMVQDFRGLHLADKEAREYLNAASRRDFARDEQRFNKVAIREELVLLRIALFLHGAAAARFGLLRVESVSDLEAEVAKLGLAPPRLGPDHAARVREFEALAASLRDA